MAVIERRTTISKDEPYGRIPFSTIRSAYDELRQTYSAKEIVELVGVSKSTVYYWDSGRSRRGSELTIYKWTAKKILLAYKEMRDNGRLAA